MKEEYRFFAMHRTVDYHLSENARFYWTTQGDIYSINLETIEGHVCGIRAKYIDHNGWDCHRVHIVGDWCVVEGLFDDREI